MGRPSFVGVDLHKNVIQASDLALPQQRSRGHGAADP